MGVYIKQPTSGLTTTQELIMHCLVFITVVVSGIVVANASGPPPPPPPPHTPRVQPLHAPPPPPYAPYRPAPYGYRPHYGPAKKVGGGLESILPLLLLGGKGGSSGIDSSVLPPLLLGGGLGGKGGKKGGANNLLPYLLLGGEKCTEDAASCTVPNTGTTLCGAGTSVKKCCLCRHKKKGLFGGLGGLGALSLLA